MRHFEQRMTRDLEHIRTWVWDLGSTVDRALRSGADSLISRDEERCYATVLGDHVINRDSLHCDQLCHSFIARHVPGAGHLREMAATIRVNVALERLGDYAVTICRGALQLEGPLPGALRGYMDTLGDESLDILQNAREAFRDRDADRARSLILSAQKIEGRMDEIYEQLAATDDQLDGRSMISIYAVFSLFKRVADQAKNICDQTLYAVEGVAKVSKRHRVLFLDQPASGIGLMATAMGRRYYPSVKFNTALPSQAETIAAEVATFLESRGLSHADLRTKQLEAMSHDVGSYDLIVCVNGDYHDYLEQVPFHSSALNWTVDGAEAAPNLTDQYRSLRTHIDELMTIVIGAQPHED